MKSTKHDAGASIGSKEFFEKTNRIELMHKVDIELSQFVESKTGNLRDDLNLVYRNCPVCQSKGYVTSFYKYGFPHLVCKNCSMLYVSPILSEATLNEFYKDSVICNGAYEVVNSDTQREFDSPKFIEGINTITKHNSNKRGKLLDIGCLTGHFMEVATNYGWDCTGIELHTKAYNFCKSSNLNVYNRPLDKINFENNYFDAITMWDVLEHLPNPKKVLSTINHILKSNGILLILVPNGGSLAARILREQCNMFNGCQHINLFSLPTIELLLDSFQILEKKTLISEFSVLTNYLNYDHPYLGKGEKCTHLLDIIDESKLHDNYLGYKLQIVAKKQ